MTEAPALFVTFTAPSFGAVHGTRDGKACLPRKDTKVCAHGKTQACWKTHADDDQDLGQPICPDCYDYEGAVLWNNAAPALWRITRINISRGIANRLGATEKQAKQLARSEYVKVIEFQQRGAVHFHVAIRLDTLPIVAHLFDTKALEEIVINAAHSASVATASGDRAQWGRQLDIKPITPEDFEDERAEVSRRQVANYLAKYATKGSDVEGKLDRRFKYEDDLKYLNVNSHLARLVRTSWRLARKYENARLDVWSHQLGYRGHFMTKSRNWSTTFKALRAVRKDHQEQLRQASWDALNPNSLIVTKWEYVGAGYRTTYEAFVAEAVRNSRRTSRAA